MRSPLIERNCKSTTKRIT